MSVIHILKAMGPRNTLVIRYCCHWLKYNRQEFYLRSGLKLDLDLTPSPDVVSPALIPVGQSGIQSESCKPIPSSLPHLLKSLYPKHSSEKKEKL